jgi:hypothetical protein
MLITAAAVEVSDSPTTLAVGMILTPSVISADLVSLLPADAVSALLKHRHPTNL